MHRETRRIRVAGTAIAAITICGGAAATAQAQQPPFNPGGTPQQFQVNAIQAAPPYDWAGRPRPGERETRITAIPGVIAADAKWELVLATFNTTDGMVATPDGGVIFAQEQTDTIRKISSTGEEQVYVADTGHAGSASIDAEGRLFVASRTCTEPLRPGPCLELTRISQLLPERRVLANSFPDGKSFGRINDLIADGKGGAWFTSRGLYHVSRAGQVTVVADDKDVFTNGLTLSRDGKTLFVTNRDQILAFDVAADGKTSNRRVFSEPPGISGGDGMSVDEEGRIYVCGGPGVHVLAPDGRFLGLIPTPRRPTTITFSGPDKKFLYAGTVGVVGPDGQPWKTPESVRNTAQTIYRIPVLTSGFKGRPK